MGLLAEIYWPLESLEELNLEIRNFDPDMALVAEDNFFDYSLFCNEIKDIISHLSVLSVIAPIISL